MKKLSKNNLPEFVYYNTRELVEKEPTIEFYKHSKNIYVLKSKQTRSQYYAIMPYEEFALWGYGNTIKEVIKDLEKSYKNTLEFEQT